MKRTLDRRIERLERQWQQNSGPSIVIIGEGDPVPEGAEHVFIDDIPGARLI